MSRRLFSLSLAAVLALSCGANVTAAPSKKTAPAAPAKKATPAPKKRSEPVEAYAVPASGVPSVQAGSAMLIDAQTGRVLTERNADQPRPVASTQKLLTALIVAEEGDLDGDVTVAAPDTWCEPSMLYIKPGQVYKRRDLLTVLLVKSMNDVARCLARDNAGSVDAFAAKMNAKAAQLGMCSSHFVNPNGLPAPGQFSTARDMAKVATAAYNNRTIRSIVKLRELSWRHPDGHTSVFKNTNRVLRNFAACNGMKTGYTEASGFCLVSSAASGGREVISVVLGDKRDAVWVDSYRLLAWGLSGEGVAQN